MKTTQGQAVRAYRALLDIQARKEITTTQTGKRLFDMKRGLSPAFEFQVEREKEIVDRLGGTIDPETGEVLFTNDESRACKMKQLNDEFRELALLETDVSVVPFSIPKNEELHVNMDEVEALYGFVAFA